jgi:ectoine hydroxylase-related dioxygenase (phytanoyl-CoA dioxygenase family)
LTCVIYLEDATVENGCTVLIPGTHLLPCTGRINNGGTWLDESEDYASLAEQALPVPMAAGDMLLFDGLVYHSVGLNQTDASRMSIAFAFRAVDELDFRDEDVARLEVVSGGRLYKGSDR